MLKDFQTESNLVKHIDELPGLFMHLKFEFNGDTTNVDVNFWTVTDDEGNILDISSLSFAELVLLTSAMKNQSDYHVQLYYHDLESSYYNRVG